MQNFEKLIFIDLETTGANAKTDAITEIGLVEVTREQITHWSTLVNPERPISQFISGLTGINDQMVADAPPIEQILDTVLKRLDGGLFIAHNARFDYGFMQAACTAGGRTLANDALCTVRLSRHLFPTEARHNLDTLITRHRLLPSGRHRALADADLLWQLWNKFGSIFAHETFDSAIRALRQTTQQMQKPSRASVNRKKKPRQWLVK